MTPSRIDAIFSALDRINTSIGAFSSDIKTLYRRADEDRATRRRERDEDRIERRLEHDENQKRIGELADATTKAIAELRGAVANQQKTIKALQLGRGKLVLLASIGFLALSAVGLAFDAALRWAIDRVLTMKFGG